jgi:glutaminyl-peptide cyclotransferase
MCDPNDDTPCSQGLVYEPDGTFLEGTGLYGHSSLRRVDAKTGQATTDRALDRKYFGEWLKAYEF